MSSDIFKVVFCGSVDDGKSTLLGRFFYENGLIKKDQLEGIIKDSKKSENISEEKLDFSLIADGLDDERSQGITIDVSHKYFEINNKKIIILDSPGHEEYTRNMFTASTHADLAVLLVDSKKGISDQTKRHINILFLTGVLNLIVCINKIDLVNYSEDVFSKIKEDITNFLNENSLNMSNISFIPTSALHGENISKTSKITDWYSGPSFKETLLKYNENNFIFDNSFMYISNIARNKEGRFYQGLSIGNNLKPGDKVLKFPNKKELTISKLFYGEKEISETKNMESISFQTNSDIDISVGDLIVGNENSIQEGRNINADIINLSLENIVLKKIYYFKFGTKLLRGRISKIKSKKFGKYSSNFIQNNEIVEVELMLFQDIIVSNYKNYSINNFIIIDPNNNQTIGGGVSNFVLLRDTTVKEEKINIQKKDKETLLGQKSFVLWFTGISGVGKTTLASEIEKALYNKNYHSILIDGDNVRKTLNSDLGFNDNDRSENARRVAELSKIIANSGIISIVSLISPYKEDRTFAKEINIDNNFLEIYLKADLSSLIKRDKKGLYKLQKQNELLNLPGVNSEYQEPTNPDLVLDTSKLTIKESTDKMINLLYEKKLI